MDAPMGPVGFNGCREPGGSLMLAILEVSPVIDCGGGTSPAAHALGMQRWSRPAPDRWDGYG